MAERSELVKLKAVWKNMRQRCLNPKDKRFSSYGGRGITVDPQWATFKAFITDMGMRPTSRHTIDRIDNDGPYTRDNCRWATFSENNSNRPRCKYYVIDGAQLTMKQVWAMKGKPMPYRTFSQRLQKLGWSLEQSLVPTRRGRIGPPILTPDPPREK